MYKTSGERLSYCRSLLGLSRRQFAEAVGGISVPTISRWELNYTAITRPKLEEIVQFFRNHGIEVTSEWIISNSDQPPINTNLQDLNKLNFDELSYITLTNLKNTIENFEIYQINNNFFEPIIYNGDYIGGVCDNNLEKLTNKLCYVVHDKMVSVGIFNYSQMCIVNFFKQPINITPTVKIGAVSWLAKRL